VIDGSFGELVLTGPDECQPEAGNAVVAGDRIANPDVEAMGLELAVDGQHERARTRELERGDQAIALLENIVADEMCGNRKPVGVRA